MSLPTKSKERNEVVVNFSDSINLCRDQVEWNPKGVRLYTKWPFAEGAEVEFSFDHRGERHCSVGIVVGCHSLRSPVGYYETVLFFTETPCSKLQKAACDCRLAPDGHVPPDDDEPHFTLAAHAASPGRRR